MLDIASLNTPMEFKAVGDGNSGEFEAYGAIFGNVDRHGDVIRAGAAKDGLTEYAAAGRKVLMHLNHGLPQIRGVPDIGAWKHIEEDSKGVLGVGKVAGMDTPEGRYHYARIRDGVFPGMSIAYGVRQGGAIYGRKSGEPKRTLTGITIFEMGPVSDPSNTAATVTQFKTLMQHVDIEAATKACVAGMMLHRSSMAGGDSPTADERTQIFGHWQAVHQALTGELMPKGMKAAPSTLREFEEGLREMGFTRSQAALIAEREFKATGPRDAGGGEAKPADGHVGLFEAVTGFSLSSFGR